MAPGSSVFPNPAENHLSIRTNAKAEVLNIKITDLSGRLVLNQSVKTDNFIATLDLSLINGAYLVTITRSDNSYITKKLIIAK
jgi:hypothetical protein